MHAVSYTAQWTAAARALETERERDRLVTDEFARGFAEPRGFELLERYGGGGLVDFVAVRTRYLDDTIAGVLAGSDIRQVVLIASGMDARAYRLSWPDGVVVYEVDHEALLAEKRRRIDRIGASPKVTRREVPADLAGDWLPSLEQAGHDRDAPTLWIAEALLFFLTHEQAASLLSALGTVSAPGSWLALDILSEQLLRSPATQLFLANLRADGIPWLFGTDEPARFLGESGWELRELKEPGEPGAGEGRWPYAVQPRTVRGVPRNWLVRAEVRRR